MSIQEIMTRQVVTCPVNGTLNQAAQLMWDYDCGAIPVVDEGGSAVGFLTDRDICMAAYTKGKTLDAIPVSSAMSKQVFSCRDDAPLEEAERLMSQQQIRRIPIVDRANRPIGMLSLNDVARYTATRGKSGLDRLLTQTLAAICQPRRRTALASWKEPVLAHPAQ